MDLADVLQKYVGRKNTAECLREMKADIMTFVSEREVKLKAKYEGSREYSQAEIESWNAQGGSFTQAEKDQANTW